MLFTHQILPPVCSHLFLKIQQFKIHQGITGSGHKDQGQGIASSGYKGKVSHPFYSHKVIVSLGKVRLSIRQVNFKVDYRTTMENLPQLKIHNGYPNIPNRVH